MPIAGTVSASLRRDTFVWTISAALWQAELAAAKEAGKEKRLYIFSPPFGNDCWSLQVNLLGEEGYNGIFLTTADAAVLPVTVAFRFEFSTDEVPPRKIRPPLNDPSHLFDAATEGWGFAKAVSYKDIDGVEPTNSVVITASITRKEPTLPPRVPLALFNSPHYGDVAFHLATADAWIFGLKPVLVEPSAHLSSLLSSDFAEGSTSTSLDPEASFDAPADLRTGDLDEFVEFSSKNDSGEVSDAEETPSTASHAAPSKDTTHGSSATVDSGAQQPTAADETPSRPATPPVPATQKRYHRVEVHDCSYSTFFSYLYWIYYDEVCFAPSRATVLSDPEKQDPRGSSAIATFPKTGRTHSTPPCDPHAMYRLADRLMHEDLRDLAKNSIATYEAFSALSRDYQDVRLAVVGYIVKNIDAVRSSSGWTRMLELLDEGRLSGGAGVIDKILEGVAAAARAKDPQ